MIEKILPSTSSDIEVSRSLYGFDGGPWVLSSSSVSAGGIATGSGSSGIFVVDCLKWPYRSSEIGEKIRGSRILIRCFRSRDRIWVRLAWLIARWHIVDILVCNCSSVNCSWLAACSTVYWNVGSSRLRDQWKSIDWRWWLTLMIDGDLTVIRFWLRFTWLTAIYDGGRWNGERIFTDVSGDEELSADRANEGWLSTIVCSVGAGGDDDGNGDGVSTVIDGEMVRLLSYCK